MGHSLVRVAHSVEGRIRLKIKRGKGNPELLDAYAAQFRALPGIERVKTNPVTGAVTLIYDPDRHSEFVSSVHRSAGLEPPGPTPPKTDLDKFADAIRSEAEFLAEHSASARVFVDAVKRLDREIKLWSGNNVDLKIMLAGGVIAATVLEIGATAATPVWVTLLLFGANSYVELRSQARETTGAPSEDDGQGARPGARVVVTAKPGKGAASKATESVETVNPAGARI